MIIAKNKRDRPTKPTRASLEMEWNILFLVFYCGMVAMDAYCLVAFCLVGYNVGCGWWWL